MSKRLLNKISKNDSAASLSKIVKSFRHIKSIGFSGDNKKSSDIKLHNYVINEDLSNLVKEINNSSHSVALKDKYNKTALDYACEAMNLTIARKLVYYGSRVSLAFYNISNEEDFIKTIQLLVRAGYNLNNLDMLGFAPIHYASSQGFTKAVKLLLNHKADVNISAHNGNNAINIASKNPHAGIVIGQS